MILAIHPFKQIIKKIIPFFAQGRSKSLRLIFHFFVIFTSEYCLKGEFTKCLFLNIWFPPKSIIRIIRDFKFKVNLFVDTQSITCKV